MSAVKRMEDLNPDDFQDAQEAGEIPADELTTMLRDIIQNDNRRWDKYIKPEVVE